MADVVIDPVVTPPVVDPVKADEVVVTPVVEVKTPAETVVDIVPPVVEEVKEPEKVTDEIAGLKADLAKLQGDLAQALAKGDGKGELDQVNALMKVKTDLVSEYESVLSAMIEAKMQDVPDNIKDLVPTNLSIKERLDWLTKAEKSGIFKTSNPDIEIGKPLNPINTKQPTDVSKLSANAIMAMAYGNSKGKNKK